MASYRMIIDRKSFSKWVQEHIFSAQTHGISKTAFRKCLSKIYKERKSTDYDPYL